MRITKTLLNPDHHIIRQDFWSGILAPSGHLLKCIIGLAV
jgi:hypothetical protein